jgi:nucleoside-diphosphate kinase
MAGKITFTIIKPDAVRKGYIGPILFMINQAGFRIQAMKYLKLKHEQAQQFYAVHEGKDFFPGLCEFMSSGPIVAAVLEKDNAIDDFRKLIGTTDPKKADEGTVRILYGESMQRNAIHGSDSDENAYIEADFFFSMLERF